MLSPLLPIQEAQLQNILEGVKSNSPILFENVNLCIDRCQALLSSGFNSTASISRHQLLQDLNEKLRHLALPTRVQRSKTSAREISKTSKYRRRSLISFSKNSKLSNIGEEESDVMLQSTTLPRKLDTFEDRPKSLKWKRSFPKAYVPPPVTSAKQTDESGNKSLRRKPKKQDGGHKRHPRIGKLGKLGSSEFYADAEDDYDVSPDVSSTHLGVADPTKDGRVIIENHSSLNADQSPRPTRNIDTETETETHKSDTQSVIVTVEVHENQGAHDNHQIVSPMTSNESTGSGHALLSTECNSRSLPSAGKHNARQRPRKVSFSGDVPSVSPNRKSGKHLSSALKESSNYVYCSIDDDEDLI